MMLAASVTFKRVDYTPEKSRKILSTSGEGSLGVQVTEAELFALGFLWIL